MQPRNIARSLSTRLIVSFLLVAIPAVAIVGGLAFYVLRDLTVANRDLHEISRSLDAVRALESSAARALMPVSEFMAYGGAGQDRLFESLMDDVEDRLRSCGNTACHGASVLPREMALRLAPYFHRIRSHASNVFATHTKSAERILHSREIAAQEHAVSAQLDHMSSALLLKVASLQQNSQDVYARAWSLMLGAIVVVVALAVLIAYFMSRQLARPIHELVLGTRHITEGNLDHRVTLNETGEIGELARSFNAMAREIEEHRARLEGLVQARTAQVKQAHDSLARSEKLASIGLLAAGVAHELNNPLTSILMNISLLMEDVEAGSELHRELKRLSDDALRCQRIINDLREFSRCRPLQIAPCDLNDVVGGVLTLTGRQLALQKVALALSLFDGMPSVPCDPNRIGQVLMNIFANAIQAMPEGGTLRVETGLRHGYASITVSDSGAGIPKSIRSKIFDPFFTTKPDGTGLGLSIVYGIMEEHGGKVEVESLETDAAHGNCGTTVRLLLPVKPEPAPRRIAAATQERAMH